MARSGPAEASRRARPSKGYEASPSRAPRLQCSRRTSPRHRLETFAKKIGDHLHFFQRPRRLVDQPATHLLVGKAQGLLESCGAPSLGNALPSKQAVDATRAQRWLTVRILRTGQNVDPRVMFSRRQRSYFEMTGITNATEMPENNCNARENASTLSLIVTLFTAIMSINEI